MRYAVSHFSTSLKLLIVLAHANCGPVTGTVDLYLEPKVIKQPGYRDALFEVAVVLNAAWGAYCLRQEFRDRLPHLGVVYGASI